MTGLFKVHTPQMVTVVFLRSMLWLHTSCPPFLSAKGSQPFLMLYLLSEGSAGGWGGDNTGGTHAPLG